jgi:DNA-binding CsgD family transcriptional regulator
VAHVLLGRGPETTRLDELIRAAAAGRGGAVVIEGDPGVGKTALLEDAAQRASRLAVLRVAGVESELTLPYAALHQLCGRMIARRDRLPPPQSDALAVALGGLAGPAPDRFLVSLGVLGLLSDFAAERPLLCLVDDAQWIDQESLQALAFVARRAEADSFALLFSTRVALDALAGVPRLVVGGLAEPDARTLLASVAPGRLDPRVRDRIIAETHGNPLALLELPHRLSLDQLAGGFGLPDPERLSSRIEEGFLRRVRASPPGTQQLLLLIAADPVGDTSVLRRAAHALGLSLEQDAGPAEAAGLISVASHVRFRHPLVRSAIYRTASPAGRRAAHGALAGAVDADADRDRRAWHLAHGTIFPSDEVAGELERSADRAKSRGGPAAAAAFLELAANLTSDSRRRATLTIASAESKYDAGALPQAAALLDGLDAASLDEADRAHLDLIRARILFTAGGSGETVVLMAKAAKRLEAVDADLARATYLHAFSAGTFLGRDVAVGQWLDLGRAASAAPPPTGPANARDMLLDGLALQFTAGYTQSLVPLRQALGTLAAGHQHVENSIEVSWLACCVAIIVWDDNSWRVLSARFVDEGHRTGALVHLLAAVQMRAIERVLAGDFAEAASLVEEKKLLTSVIGPTHGGDSAAIFLAAWRGHEMKNTADAVSPPASQIWGFEADVSCYATAVLCNALGQYKLAMEAARTFLADANGRWAPALPELVEAAMRCGSPELARRAVGQLATTTAASGTHWATGLETLCRALTSDDDDAERHFLKSIDHLNQTRVVTSLARATLLYGEWLRRQGRRIDARRQLRAASDMFVSMGAEAFAARARRELSATGERLPKRSVSPAVQLTSQETQIVRLAMDGQANAEIAAQMFISPRTVEYHLHKIFTKLGITSRNQLSRALQQTAVTPLLVGDPVAVEAERNAGRQVDPGDRFAAEVLRGQDDQVGGAAVGVVDEGHDVAVVLGGGRGGGDEDGLAGGGAGGELVRLGRAAGQVVLEQRVGEGLVGDVAGQRDEGVVDLADDGAVAVAVRPGNDPLVDPRELLEPVVEPVAGDPGGGRVQGPPVQRDRAVPAQGRHVEGPGVGDDIHDDLAVAVVVGVQGVEHPARLDLEPADLRRAAVPGQQADPGLVVGVPRVGQSQPRGRPGQAEGHRQVEQHNVLLRQGEIMHHGPVGDGDVGRPGHQPVPADDHVLDVVPGPVVGDGVQFPGTRVELGVRGVAAGQGTAEVAGTRGAELGGQLVRQRAGFHGGQGAPGMPDDVGVGTEVGAVVHRPGRPFLAEGLGHLLGADPAVAVPLGPAVPQPDAVHHARAHEPVVAGIFQAQRVRPVAQVAAAEPGGHPAGDRQVEGGDFLGDRGERAIEKSVGLWHCPRSSRRAWKLAPGLAARADHASLVRPPPLARLWNA